MASFIIEGGYPLSGEITPQGAKNEALQVICATLLTSEEVTIHNIPDIRDVNNLIQLLSDIGVRVKRKEVIAKRLLPKGTQERGRRIPIRSKQMS